MLVYGYGYSISTYIDIEIAPLIYCRICWTAIRLLTKEEANVLSHAMVEKKDTEGGCSGLWLLSDCRAEFYGILGLVYA